MLCLISTLICRGDPLTVEVPRGEMSGRSLLEGVVYSELLSLCRPVVGVAYKQLKPRHTNSSGQPQVHIVHTYIQSWIKICRAGNYCW